MAKSKKPEKPEESVEPAKSPEELQLNYQLQRELYREVTRRTLVKSCAWVIVVLILGYFGRESIIALAGKVTKASFVLNILGNITMSRGLLLA